MTSSGGTKNSILKALKCGNCEKLAELLNSKLDGISGDMAVDPANNRILHRAARYGKIDVVKRLLQVLKCTFYVPPSFALWGLPLLSGLQVRPKCHQQVRDDTTSPCRRSGFCGDH